MKALVLIARLAALAPTVLAAMVLFAMMAMTFADVLLRSAFNAPIEAATELTRISMAVVVFSVLPVVSSRGEHISVDLLDPWFGRIATRIREAAISLGCGAILWWPAGACLKLAERARSYGDVTEYLAIPEFYVAWFIAISVHVTAGLLVVRGLVILAAPGALADDEPTAAHYHD